MNTYEKDYRNFYNYDEELTPPDEGIKFSIMFAWGCLGFLVLFTLGLFWLTFYLIF